MEIRLGPLLQYLVVSGTDPPAQGVPRAVGSSAVQGLLCEAKACLCDTIYTWVLKTAFSPSPYVPVFVCIFSSVFLLWWIRKAVTNKARKEDRIVFPCEVAVGQLHPCHCLRHGAGRRGAECAGSLWDDAQL